MVLFRQLNTAVTRMPISDSQIASGNDNQNEGKLMNISSINSSSSAMMSGAMKRPDPSKMANDLFSKLDATGKGYIEKNDLENALSNLSQSGNSSGTATSSKAEADALFAKMDSNGNGKVTKEEMSAAVQKIAAELDGQSPRMRLQSGSPPPPPPQGGDQNASSTGSSKSSQTSDPADTNGDGTVSASEALAYAESQASSSTNSISTTSSSTSSADAQLLQQLAGNIPPPQDGGQSDQGFTKDQLTAISKELSSTDSKRSKVMSDVASNFDAADTNGDGRVTGTEARAFEESKNSSSSSTSISSSTPSSDAQFMKKMMELLKSYGSFDQTTGNSSFSTSA